MLIRDFVNTVSNRPLTGLAVVHLTIVIFFFPAGYFTWDSGTYHLMLRTLFDGNLFFVQNGYDELPVEILRLGHTVAPTGRLVSQYPEIYTLIAAPFYFFFGYKGLIILNAFAFIGTNWLIWSMARWFVNDRRAPAVAALIFSFSTFAWEFSLSSYPHLTATCLIVAAFWLFYSVVLRREDMPDWLRREGTTVPGTPAASGTGPPLSERTQVSAMDRVRSFATALAHAARTPSMAWLQRTGAAAFAHAPAARGAAPQSAPAVRNVAGYQRRLLLAGLCLGLAIGVRLDSLFAGLAFAIPLLHGRGVDWRRGRWVLAGLAGPILLLSLINYMKFGSLNFLSYGRPASYGYLAATSHYLPIGAALAVGCLVYTFRRLIFRIPRYTAWILFALMIAALFVPTRWFISDPNFEDATIGRGLWQIIVDLRIRPNIAEAALERSPTGAVLYFGQVKKALLQSCPYLILLLVPGLWRWLRGDRDSAGFLWLVPLGFIAVYGSLAWHGSVGASMRYLIPALPFFAILATKELVAIGARSGWFLPYRVFYLPMLLLLCAQFISAQSSSLLIERLVLDASLILALLLLALQCLNLARVQTELFKPGKLLAVLFPFALLWSCALSVTQDFAVFMGVQTYYRAFAAQVVPTIPPDAVVFTYNPNAVWPVLDRHDRTIIASYTRGDCGQIATVVGRYIGRRPIVWIENQDRETFAKWHNCFPLALPDGGRAILESTNMVSRPGAGIVHRITQEGAPSGRS